MSRNYVSLEVYNQDREDLRSRAGLTGRDRIACVVCGGLFISVCNHAYLKHGLSARDYKKLAGLPISEGVITDEYRARRQAISAKHCEGNPNKMMLMRVASPPGSGRGKREPGLTWMQDVKDRSLTYRKRYSRERAELWESRREEFSRLWLAGESVGRMCKIFDCDSRTLGRYREKFGLPPRVICMNGIPVAQRD